MLFRKTLVHEYQYLIAGNLTCFLYSGTTGGTAFRRCMIYFLTDSAALMERAISGTPSRGIWPRRRSQRPALVSDAASVRIPGNREAVARDLGNR
jgi:hypothetical protein